MKSFLTALSLALTVWCGEAAATFFYPPTFMPEPQFYWASAGNDSNDCKSPATACQTITHFNAFSFPSNAIVHFHGGDTFSGGVVIPRSNMFITTYGAGQPTITPTAGNSCFSSTDQHDITINNFICTGTSNSTDAASGIIFTNDTTAQLANITVTNNTVSLFSYNCVGFNATNASPHGYSNVTVNNNLLHDCTGNTSGGTSLSGVGVFGPFPGSTSIHTNITISNNTIYNMIGSSAATGTNATGFGIFVQSASTVMISTNLVHDNGASDTSTSGGPVGIITAFVNIATIQFNQVYLQSGGTHAQDGEGIDLDDSTTNAVVQYNYVLDNTTAEIFVFNNTGGFGGNSNNTIRFNVTATNVSIASEGILITNGGGNDITNLSIYNNTIYAPGALYCIFGGDPNAGTMSTWVVANNICESGFVQFNLAASFNAGGNNPVMTGNDYYAIPSATFRSVLDGNTSYTSLASMQSAGYEKPGGTPTGITSNPTLNAPAITACTSGAYQPTCVHGKFGLQGGSPAIGTGLNLNTLYGYNVGTQDFGGTAITASTLPIGAFAN